MEENASTTQLAGFLGFVRRSGALAPFLNVLIISIVPFAMIAMKDGVNACEQPIIFWGLLVLSFEIILIFVIGIIIACRNPELLMTEAHQEKMKQIGERGRSPSETPQCVPDGKDVSNDSSTHSVLSKGTPDEVADTEGEGVRK